MVLTDTTLIWLFRICAGVGALVLAYILLIIIIAIFTKCCCRGRQNLLEKYGEGQRGVWAVVTGGSDGIGLSICYALAAQGFNICMVARSRAKMEERLAAIKEEFPLCETKAVIADFSKMSTMAEYRRLVTEGGIDKLDVGYLALNAGVV
jgi:5,10-methylene-tetrahydrofolate dehydrogenase/methenyl tetrahydrofolate cyclohydrolase